MNHGHPDRSADLAHALAALTTTHRSLSNKLRDDRERDELRAWSAAATELLTILTEQVTALLAHPSGAGTAPPPDENPRGYI